MIPTFKPRERKRNLVIVFANQKGGAGKTSICAMYSNHLAGIGRKFLDIDTDAQRSLTKLREENKNDHPDWREPYFIYHFDELDSEKYTNEMLEDARDVEGDVIIDSPGSLSKPGMMPLMMGADFIVIPYSYDENTILSTIGFIRFLKTISKGKKMPQVIFVCNRYNQSWTRKDDIKQMEQTDKGFSEFGLMAPRIPSSSEITRVNTYFLTPKQKELTLPTFTFLDNKILGI